MGNQYIAMFLFLNTLYVFLLIYVLLGFFFITKLFPEIPRYSSNSFQCLQMVITDQAYLSQKHIVELLTAFVE